MRQRSLGVPINLPIILGTTLAALALRTPAVDASALTRLVEAARQSDSSALVVVQRGEVLGEWYFDGPPRPLETQSITKSVVALVLGSLVGSEGLPSLDVPVHRFYPQWKQGLKQKITVRHLLTHTSCLQDTQSSADEIAPARDVVELALAAELSCVPGEAFAYSNKAPNLLAGIVEQVSGRPLDEVARAVLFEPLGIAEMVWCRDPAGNPLVMGGLHLRPRDLARIGELVALQGQWQGRQILPAAWFRAIQTPGFAGFAEHGLLWWLPRLPWYRRWLRPDAPVGLAARGWRGQYLLVLPAQQLVVVRLYDIARGVDRPAVDFRQFEALARSLVGA